MKLLQLFNYSFFDLDGELFIQKRNAHKNHNPGLLDKSIGGHIKYGDTPEYTAMVETVQELQIPSIVTTDKNNFIKTFDLLKSHLNSVAILFPVKKCFGNIVNQEKIIDGRITTIASKIYLYFGVYTGAIKTVDNEAKGILMYDLEDIKQEMQETPNAFTNDLNYFLHYYSDQISKFVKTIKNI